MTNPMKRSRLNEPRLVHRIWEPAVAALIIGVVLIAAGCCAYWLFRTPERTARDAAHTIGVTIPPNATNITARDDRINFGDTRCTDLSFLMPTEQWAAYVQPYFPDGLSRTSKLNRSCTVAMDCPQMPSDLNRHFEASIDDDHVTMRRGVIVIPDCEPGRALIMWLTVRK